MPKKISIGSFLVAAISVISIVNVAPSNAAPVGGLIRGSASSEATKLPNSRPTSGGDASAEAFKDNRGSTSTNVGIDTKNTRSRGAGRSTAEAKISDNIVPSDNYAGNAETNTSATRNSAKANSNTNLILGSDGRGESTSKSTASIGAGGSNATSSASFSGIRP
jgi:hypothetical protein